jgi:hypothetical protein
MFKKGFRYFLNQWENHKCYIKSVKELNGIYFIVVKEPNHGQHEVIIDTRRLIFSCDCPFFAVKRFYVKLHGRPVFLCKHIYWAVKTCDHPVCQELYNRLESIRLKKAKPNNNVNG